MSGWTMLRPGDLFGDLRVLKELGRGGMGAVYLVMDEESGRKYAAKILFPEAEAKDHDVAVGRFIREAEIAMAIEHPNLIKVYDVGRDPETGFGYLLMDFISGGSLYDRLMNRLAQGEGPFSVKEAVGIVRQMASVLAAAEKHGIIHRDIKPDNILFDETGKPYLADLGIAKRAGVQATMTLTMTDMVVGTPAYMSPEHLTDSKHVDIRADIYSLGIVLWQLLAGELPYDDSSMTALLTRAVKKIRIPDIRLKRPKISRKIALLLRKMTAPSVEHRFQHPGDIIAFLDEYAAHERRVLLWTIVGCSLGPLLAFGALAWFAWRVLDKTTANSRVVSDDRIPVEARQMHTAVEDPAVVDLQTNPVRAETNRQEKAIENAPLPVDALPAEKPIVQSAKSVDSTRRPAIAVEQKEVARPVATPTEMEDFLAEYKRIKLHPRAEELLTVAVNAARRIDPDFAQYDWKGESREGGIGLSEDEIVILRRGKVYRQCELIFRRTGKMPEAAALPPH